MGDMRNAYKIFVLRSEGRDLTEDSRRWEKILYLILENGMGRCGLYSSASG